MLPEILAALITARTKANTERATRSFVRVCTIGPHIQRDKPRTDGSGGPRLEINDQGAVIAVTVILNHHQLTTKF